MSNDGKHSLLPVFLTVFIDMLGIGIIIPVIPALFFEMPSDFFATDVVQAERAILYGFLIAAFPVMQFFGAPVLGALSDRYGRKPMLIVSLLGTMVGYLLFAFALLQGNLWLLFFSRMLPGFTGGNISIVYAAIADSSEGAERTRNFGLVGMAFGLGFILGPALGGVMADDTVLPWFNSSTPFWFTGGLTLLNVLLVLAFFKETLQEKGTQVVSMFTGMRNILYSFKMPNLRVIFTVALLVSLGFTFFTQFFAVILIQDFSYSEKDIGLFYAWIGIWLVFTQGFLVRKLSNWFAPSKILRITLLALAIAVGLVALPLELFWIYALSPLIAISQGINAPNMLSVISDQASPSEQGSILGINQSMQSLGNAVPPIIGGYLTAQDSSYPIIAAAAFIFVGWLVYVVLFRGQR